jgi:hypothetical protein
LFSSFASVEFDFEQKATKITKKNAEYCIPKLTAILFAIFLFQLICPTPQNDFKRGLRLKLDALRICLRVMSTLEMTVEELKSLPPAKLEDVARYIHQLKLASDKPGRGALEQSFGCLSAAEGEELEQAIAANCERIDASQW